jgi:V8-like Glu-specific endopeptidase
MSFLKVILCLFLVACAKDDNHQQLMTEYEDAISRQFNDLELRPIQDCNLDKFCSGAVGLLLSFERSKKLLMKCTAFHIGDGKIITNAHCIQKSKGSFARYYIPDGRVFNIRQITYLGHQHLDLAVLQIEEKSKLSILEVDANSGLNEDQNIKMVSFREVELGSKRFKLVIEDLCVIKKSSLIFGAEYSDKYRFAFTKCQIIPGDSGSPLIFENGKVGGLVYARIGDSAGQITKALQKHVPEATLPLARLGFAIGGHCLMLENLQTESCYQTDLTISDLVTTIKALLTAHPGSYLSQWLQLQSDHH